MKIKKSFRSFAACMVVGGCVAGLSLVVGVAKGQETSPDPIPNTEACPSSWQEVSRTPASYDFVCQNSRAVIKVTDGSVKSQLINSCSGAVENQKTEVLSYSVSGPTEITYPPSQPGGEPDGPYDQYTLTPTKNGQPDGDPAKVVAPQACDICPH